MKKEILKNRVDFMAVYEVVYGNPNGGPDEDNRPRQDQETGYGLVTDVCLKRKVRNYIQSRKSGEPGYGIYITSGVPTGTLEDEAIEQVDTKGKGSFEAGELVKEYLCNNYFDIRTFGAVLTSLKKANLGESCVNGPVQIGFSRSVDPINPQVLTIDRISVANEKEAKTKSSTMGRKWVVPYAVYTVKGHISPDKAKKTGFTEDDLNVFFEALYNMFDDDASAARPDMAVRKLIIFKHDSAYGNEKAFKLFDRISINRISDGPARCFSDYELTIDESDMPKGVELIVLQIEIISLYKEE